MTVRKKLLTLAAMPLLALTLSACALLEGNELAPTIAEIVVENDATSTLETAVVQEGLDGALADITARYTVFAPSDAAFQAFLDELGIDAAALLALPDLAEILLYHVVDGDLPASQVVSSAPGDLTTLQGNDLAYAVVDGGVQLTDATGRTVNVVETDINAFNGVIHLIDSVLLPFGTITDIAVATEATSTLEAAVVEAGLAGALADLSVAYTVFAPTDTAFGDFLAANSLTAEELLASPNLASILLYHVVPSELFAADVIAAAPTTVPTLEGGTIDVAVVDGTVQLTDENGVTMNVVATDVNALNGVIHLIDYVLTPVSEAE